MKQMRVKSWTGNLEPITVQDFVSSEITDIDQYSGGIAEHGHAIAKRNAEAIGRLVQILTDNGQLTPEQVKHIAQGWQSDNVADVFV